VRTSELSQHNRYSALRLATAPYQMAASLVLEMDALLPFRRVWEELKAVVGELVVDNIDQLRKLTDAVISLSQRSSSRLCPTRRRYV
jgi:hypothetical protein